MKVETYNDFYKITTRLRRFPNFPEFLAILLLVLTIIGIIIRIRLGQ